MIHIFFGQEDFQKERAIAKLKSELGDPQMLSLNTTILDEHRLTLDQLRASCDTVPFLSPQRLVIAKGVLGRFESGSGSEGTETGDKPEKNQKSDNWQSFAGYLQNLPPFTVLIFVDGQLSPRNSLLKALREIASVVEFRPLSGPPLQNWVQSEAKSAGGDMSAGAARMLADTIGSNLWVLSSEIAKLVSYARGRTVREDDVKSCVAYVREGNIFAMVDAIIERRQTTALRLLHQLLDDGAAPPYLVVMIVRQYRMMLHAKLLQNQRLSMKDLMTKMGITRDFVLEKTLQQASKYSLEGLEAAYQSLLNLDVATKTGLTEGTIALEMLVAEFSSSITKAGVRS